MAPIYQSPASPMTPTEQFMYEQGSDACRNYSGLTSRARTFAQLIAAAAISVAFASECQQDQRPQLLSLGGIILCAVSVGLGLIDWHYQSAFAAIRDRLASMEAHHGCSGPWRAHLAVRTGLADHVASYVPFFLLALLGIVGIIWGTWGLEQRLVLLLVIVLGLIYCGCAWWFAHRCGRKSEEHKTFQENLNRAAAEAHKS